MNWSLRRTCMILLALVLVVGAVLTLPVNAEGNNLIALPHGYFSGEETDPPFLFEGQLGYNFTYDTYPTAEVDAYIKYLDSLGFDAEPTNKLLHGMRSRSVNYQGQLCVKINYRPKEKLLTILLFQGKLEELGFSVAAEQAQMKGEQILKPWDPEQFFGTASAVVNEDNRTKYSFDCTGYPRALIDDYCDVLENCGLKKGSMIGMFGPSKTRKYTLDGEQAVQIGWLDRENRLNVYIYDAAFEKMKAEADATASATATVPPIAPPVDEQTGATPTVAAGMCKVCGLDFGTYDGYCYYCHPDFLFTCVICGNVQPYHRPADGVCEACVAAQGSVDSVTGATG